MARQPDVSAEFVEEFLETGDVTEAHIDRLIEARAPEGVQLEYKGGDWLKDRGGAARRGDPVKPGARLMAWVSSFANTAGGVLLVGIDDARNDLGQPLGFPRGVNNRTCTDWTRDAIDLQERAARALHALAERHDAPPRVAVVEHRDGLVLVVGVDRAPELIPCFESGAPIYYVRTHAGTGALPDIVAADLLVGRRARPTIELGVHLRQESASVHGVTLSVQLTISNGGLVWVDDLRAGIVFRSAGCRDARTPLESRLARSIAASEPACILHVPAREMNDRWGALPPMAEVMGMASASLPGRLGQFSMAVYVVARGHPPSWWQVDGEIEPGLLLAHQRQVSPCRGERPRVAFVPSD